MAGYLTSPVTKVRNCLDVPIRIEAIKFPDFVVFSEEVLPNRYIEVVYSDLRIEQNPDRTVYIYIIVDLDGDGTNYTKIHINPSYVRDHKQIDITTPSAAGIKFIKGNMFTRIGFVVVVRRFATKVGKSAKNLINFQCKEESINVVDCIEAATPPKDDQVVPQRQKIAQMENEKSKGIPPLALLVAKEDTGVVDCTHEIEINGGVEPECLDDQGQKIKGTLKEDIFFLHSYYAVVTCIAVGTTLVLPVKRLNNHFRALLSSEEG